MILLTLRQLFDSQKNSSEYQLKTPYRNGTTHVVFEPLDFMAKLAALIPKPKVNLTRFHGVMSKLQALYLIDNGSTNVKVYRS
jgi:hypothetical protein